MNIIKVILLASLSWSMAAPAMEMAAKSSAARESAPVEFMPPAEIQVMILENLIDKDSWANTLQNIFSFAQINRSFRQTLNSPSVMKWLIKTLVKTFNKDELFVLEGLKKMPGLQTEEWRNRILALQIIAAVHNGMSVGYAEAVKKILAKAKGLRAFNINSIQDENGDTLLQFALRGYFQNIRRLYTWYDLNESNTRARLQDMLEIIKLLLAAGAVALNSDTIDNAQTEDGKTLLQLTISRYFELWNSPARQEIFKIIQLLLAAGADVNVGGGPCGGFPVDRAVTNQDIELLKEILKYNPNVSDSDMVWNAVAIPDPIFMTVLLDYVARNHIVLSPEIQERIEAWQEQQAEQAQAPQENPGEN